MCLLSFFLITSYNKSQQLQYPASSRVPLILRHKLVQLSFQFPAYWPNLSYSNPVLLPGIQSILQCLVAKPLNRIEAKGHLVMIQTLLLFKCKLICYHANQMLVSITTRSPSASLQIKGLATKYTTIKWPIKHIEHKKSFFCR